MSSMNLPHPKPFATGQAMGLWILPLCLATKAFSKVSAHLAAPPVDQYLHNTVPFSSTAPSVHHAVPHGEDTPLTSILIAQVSSFPSMLLIRRVQESKFIIPPFEADAIYNRSFSTFI